MTRRIRVNPPSSTKDVALDRTLREVTDQLNLLPGMSIISTSGGPESNFSGNAGDIAVDVGSSATTFWGKTSGNDDQIGWSEFGMIAAKEFGSLRITTAQIMTNVGAATKIPFNTSGYVNGSVTADTTNNQFFVGVAGDYSVQFDAAVKENAGATTAVAFELYINDSATGIDCATDLASGALFHSCGLSSVISVASNDSVQIFATSDNGTDDLSLDFGNFTLHQIK